MKANSFASIFLCLISMSLVSQNQSVEKNEVFEKFGLFNYLKTKPRYTKDGSIDLSPPKKIFSFMPIISANPVVGLSLGLAFNESFRLGDYRDTKYSSVNFVPVYTTKEQYSFGINNTIFSNKNKWRFNGGMNYIYFPQGTSGLGSRTPQAWTHLVNPTTFKLQQTASYQFFKNFYLGIGISYFNVNIKEPDADAITNRIQKLQSDGATTYSEFQDGLKQSADFGIKVFDQSIIDPSLSANFDPTLNAEYIQRTYFRTPLQNYSLPRNISNKYNMYGIQVEMTYDSRDNINQAESGSYINILYSYYPNLDKGMGDKACGILSIDLRKYIALDSRKRSFLNLWSWTSLAHGDVPYLALPATGADPSAKSTMAYKTGGYRSDFIFTGQMEYRYYIWKFLAAGAFVSINTLREQEDFIPFLNEGLPESNLSRIETNRKWQFANYNPSVGPILSFFLDKNSRTSMNFCYAFGAKEDPGNYFDAANKGFYMYMSATF